MISQDELCDRAQAISNDRREPLVSDREDLSYRLARIAIIEDAEFQAANVLLNDRVASCHSEIRNYVILLPGDRHTASAILFSTNLKLFEYNTPT